MNPANRAKHWTRRTRHVNGSSIRYGKLFEDDCDVLIAWNDALKFLKSVPDHTASLIVTSPPYNMGKPYEQSLAFLGYMRWQRGIIDECVRILKPEGSICWEVGNYLKNKELFPLDIFFYDLFKEFGLKLRNRIVWHFGHGLHASGRFSGRYETILWFTKGDKYVFNLDPIRVRQKYPGKRAYK